MLNARQVNSQEQDQPNRLNHIKFLSAPVGSGKTELIINHIRDNFDQSYIFVSPTQELGRQIYIRLVAALVNHGQGNNVHHIYAEEGQAPVRTRILSQVHEKRPDENHVLVISAEAFRMMLKSMDDRYKAIYNVFLDEGIDSIESEIFSPNEHGPYLEPISITEGVFSIAEGYRALLETVANSPLRLAALGREELNNQRYIKIAKLLISDIYDVYGSVQDNSIQAVAFLKPDKFLAFHSVTMIMAIFEQSLLALFWQEKYEIEFRPFENITGLFDTHQIKGPSIRIHYLLHPNDHASIYNLKRHWETGEPCNDQYGNNRVIDRVAMAVEERFGNLTYCWAANNFFSNHGRILQGNRMPTECAGLDHYKNTDVVVSMTCMNPDLWLKTMVTQHVNISDDRLYELWKLSYTYQTIGRCSIRDRDSDRPIDVVVVSHRCAEQIQELFVGAEIVGQLTDLPVYTSEQTRGPAQNPSGYTQAENAKWYRLNRKYPNHTLSRAEWIEMGGPTKL